MSFIFLHSSCIFRENLSSSVVGVILGPETFMQMLVSQSVKSRNMQAKHIAMRGTCAYTS